YRIELGEIEVTLGQHPGVRDCVVLAREDIPGNKRLVAYIVNEMGAAPAVSELRGFLQQRLPEYMVPMTFVWLDNLPITINGKIDREALPSPDRNWRRPLGQPFKSPGEPLERQLAQIWEEILCVQPVGIADNFFDL